jgi:hypothetical protein
MRRARACWRTSSCLSDLEEEATCMLRGPRDATVLSRALSGRARLSMSGMLRFAVIVGLVGCGSSGSLMRSPEEVRSKVEASRRAEGVARKPDPVDPAVEAVAAARFAELDADIRNGLEHLREPPMASRRCSGTTSFRGTSSTPSRRRRTTTGQTGSSWTTRAQQSTCPRLAMLPLSLTLVFATRLEIPPSTLARQPGAAAPSTILPADPLMQARRGGGGERLPALRAAMQRHAVTLGHAVPKADFPAPSHRRGGSRSRRRVPPFQPAPWVTILPPGGSR